MRLRFLLPFVLLAVPAAAQDYPTAYGDARSGYDTDGQSVESIAVFFEPLSHYGRWVDSRFGRAWTPNVNRDWRPYTIGHWEEGRFGQTWRSDEPFGWAVFHFGRWGFDPAIGWVWTPDTVWGPGWVAWRDSDDVTGWAPLPPQVSLNFAFGGGYGFNSWGYDQWYQPSWVFVPRGALYGRSLRGVILPYGRNRNYWEGTRGVTRYDRVDGRVVNRSFDGDRGRGDHREPGVPRGDRRPDYPPQGAVDGDVHGSYSAPRRDYGRPADGTTPPSTLPRDEGRGGFQRQGGFVPFQPHGGPDGGRRAPPTAIAPAAGAVVVRPQAAPPVAHPRVETPRPAPAPRPVPQPRPAQQEVGERNRPQ